MAHRTRRYSGEATVLVACSICPRRAEYPTEIRLCSDKLWRCDDHWNETIKQDEDRAVAASRKHKEAQLPRLPFSGAWVDED